MICLGIYIYASIKIIICTLFVSTTKVLLFLFQLNMLRNDDYMKYF